MQIVTSLSAIHREVEASSASPDEKANIKAAAYRSIHFPGDDNLKETAPQSPERVTSALTAITDAVRATGLSPADQQRIITVASESLWLETRTAVSQGDCYIRAKAITSGPDSE